VHAVYWLSLINDEVLKPIAFDCPGVEAEPGRTRQTRLQQHLRLSPASCRLLRKTDLCRRLSVPQRLLHGQWPHGVHTEPSEWIKDQAVSGYMANGAVLRRLGRSFARKPQRGSSWHALDHVGAPHLLTFTQIDKRRRDRTTVSRCSLLLVLFFIIGAANLL
jgi:hypothetical protein